MVSAYRSFCVLWAGLGCVTLSVPEGSGGSVLWRIQQYKYELKVDYMLITRVFGPWNFANLNFDINLTLQK